MSDAVRKAIMQVADALMASDVSAESGVDVCKKIDCALAACDEPCVWTKDGGGYWMPGCVDEAEGYTFDPFHLRADRPWTHCPFCGHEIKEADDDDA